MEVLDSECETWEPLPNPPSRIAPSGMVSVVLEHTKQILLTLLLRNNFEVHYDYYGDCVVYIYDVPTRCWTEFDSPPFNLRCASSITSSNRALVATDDTHFWALLKKDDVFLVVHAYNLYENELFKGSINIERRIITMK